MPTDTVVDTVETPAPPNDGAKPDAVADSQKPDPGVKTGAAPVKNADDDRNKGILADLQKERKARQALEQRITAAETSYKTSLDAERRRVQALAGLEPRSQADTEADEVRQRFGQIFPGLAKLTDTQIERLLQLADNSESMVDATQQTFVRHGREMLAQVTKGVEAQLGGTLTERQSRAVKRAYADEAEANPEFLARHDQGDPTLIAEFVKNWVDDWFEPARRKVTQNELDRQRRVPSGRDRSLATGTGKKPLDYNNPKAVEDALVESFKQHGGAFGE